MNPLRKLTPKEKALKINLDRRIYGTFAEIGGGQEVASNFFKAGSASGTIAKTMSAYDMKFSDAIYGKVGRYVSEERMDSMLNREFELLQERLKDEAVDTRFFAFANTIETVNYAGTNRGHGWLGVRFQLSPMSAPNEVVLHLRLNDRYAIWQQEVLGIVGVNLIFSCFFIDDPEEFISSIADSIDKARIEVDMFRIKGPDYKHVDNRLMSLLLVKNGLSNMVMFDKDGKMLQPSEALYRKNVLLLRGRFRPVTHVNVDMMISGYRQFKQEEDVDTENIVTLAELNFHDLKKEGGDVDLQEYLHTADLLNSLGQNVLVSSFREYFRIVDYMAQFTRSMKVGIILGIYALHNIFDESYYKDLHGGILEAFGHLFGRNVKLYVYPSFRRMSHKLYGLEEVEVPENLQPLLQYMFTNNKIAAMTDVKTEHLHIVSDTVLEMIRTDEPGWEDLVPKRVAEAVKKYCLFDYPCDPETGKPIIGSRSKAIGEAQEAAEDKG